MNKAQPLNKCTNGLRKLTDIQAQNKKVSKVTLALPNISDEGKFLVCSPLIKVVPIKPYQILIISKKGASEPEITKWHSPSKSLMVGSDLELEDSSGWVQNFCTVHSNPPPQLVAQ